jgi:hypothetical protein
MKKQLFFITCMFLVFACKHEDLSKKAILNISNVPDSMVVLNKWQILGPFSSNNQEHFMDSDNLKLFGLSEDNISFEKFLMITKHQAKDTSLLDTSFSNTFFNSGKIPTDFSSVYKIGREKFKGNVYCACLVVCQKEIKTRLHFSSNASEKIWLNGKQICSVDYMKPLFSYEQFIPVTLKKGPNFLFVKISKSFSGWEMYARLENESETAIKRHFGLHNHSILNGSIFSSDTIQLDGNFPPCSGRITVLDNSLKKLFSDTIIQNNSWLRSIAPFKTGIYHVAFKTGNIALTQDFYKGDLHDSIPKVIKKIQALQTSGRIKDNLDALIHRYNHLLTNTYPADPKYVTLFIQLTNAYNEIIKEVNPFHHTPGYFIRSYISDIDSSKQYYILHVPTSYDKNKPSAIAANMPATIYDGLPYLESFRVANSKLITFFQDLAEKYNLIFFEPGSRRFKYPNYNTIEEAEFFNILNDIKKDYNVDATRLYITGTCSGGGEVLQMAVKFPDRFAGLGLIAPEVIYPNESRNSPIPQIKNIINMPIFDIHSAIDRHIDVTRSDLLNRIAKELNFANFKYVRLPNEFPKYHVDDFFDDALEFCSKHALNLSPHEIDFTTPHIIYNKSFWITLKEINSPDTAHIHAKIKGNTLTVQKEKVVSYSVDLTTLPFNREKPLKIIDNGKEVYNKIAKANKIYIGPRATNTKVKNNIVAGPFAHVFTSKFLIVKGTSGSQDEKKHLSALADTINKYWYQRYFVPCKIKSDAEITNKDIAEANLVLLGNFNSNAILAKLQNELPLKISDSGIQIQTRTTKGERLCFYMIYPNPLNSNHYVAIIGYNNPKFISLGAEGGEFNDVSDYGWYDFKVWSIGFTENELAGFFNSNWQ